MPIPDLVDGSKIKRHLVLVTSGTTTGATKLISMRHGIGVDIFGIVQLFLHRTESKPLWNWSAWHDRATLIEM